MSGFDLPLAVTLDDIERRCGMRRPDHSAAPSSQHADALCTTRVNVHLVDPVAAEADAPFGLGCTASQGSYEREMPADRVL